MRPNEAAEILGIATSTIRAWSNGEYRPYLSPTAQGGTGRYRNLTEQDVRILVFIAALKSESTPRNEIHAALKRMQAEGWADLPPMPTAPPGVGPVSMIPREAAETAVTTQRQALLREIAILQQQLEKVETDLDNERQRRETERKEAQENREKLIRQLAEAEAELRLWREGRLKPGD